MDTRPGTKLLEKNKNRVKLSDNFSRLITVFKTYCKEQFSSYNDAINFYTKSFDALIDIEFFIMEEIKHFINLHLPEIKRDYDEASYLYSFWRNYPPLDRGRSPKGDQFLWIEVGEQVFGNKLSRYFASTTMSG